MKRYPLNSLFRISHDYDCGAKKDIFIMFIKRRSSLIPRPVRVIRVTRRGLEPSAIVFGKFFRQALQVTSHLISPRTAGNEAGAEVVLQRDIYLVRLVSLEGKIVPVSAKSAF